MGRAVAEGAPRALAQELLTEASEANEAWEGVWAQLRGETGPPWDLSCCP